MAVLLSYKSGEKREGFIYIIAKFELSVQYCFSQLLKTGPKVIKLFLSVICEFSKKARVFIPSRPYESSIMLVGMAGSQP